MYIMLHNFTVDLVVLPYPSVLLHNNQLYSQAPPHCNNQDIMQQMPTEGRLFREVDGTWRQIMAACVAAPKALEVGVEVNVSPDKKNMLYWSHKLMRNRDYGIMGSLKFWDEQT